MAAYECKCGISGKENFYQASKYYCKVCWNKKTYRTGIDKIRDLKIEYGGKCKKCGYHRCLDALEFHHRDPAVKEFSLSSRRGLKYSTLKQELDKCDLLCANCHREEHAL